MPFKSSQQAKFLASQHPSVFKKFLKDGKKKGNPHKKPGNKFTEGLKG